MPVKEIQKKLKFVQGNEACAQAAIDAGVRFFAGYPITPSSEIAEILAQRLPFVGGKFIQMEDEIASIGAMLGASLAGSKTMTATSGPGFSLMQELIGYAALCEIPCVIVNVQRGGPSTGLPTLPAQSDVMQSRWGTHGDHPAVVLAPSSVKEMYDLTVRAINFSEMLRNPVILLADEVIGHLYEKIEFPDAGDLKIINRSKPKKCGDKPYSPFKTSSLSGVPDIANFGDGFRFHVTGLIHDEDGFPTVVPQKIEKLITRLHEKVNARVKDICLWEEEWMSDAEIVLCSYGVSARTCLQAAHDARSKGLKVGFLTLKTLWPFPEFLFKNIKQNIKAIVVCELNMGQIVHEVRRAVQGKCNVVGIHAVRGSMITPGEVLEKIKKFL